MEYVRLIWDIAWPSLEDFVSNVNPAPVCPTLFDQEVISDKATQRESTNKTRLDRIHKELQDLRRNKPDKPDLPLAYKVAQPVSHPSMLFTGLA